MVSNTVDNGLHFQPTSPSRVFEDIAQTNPNLDLTGSISKSLATLIGTGGYGNVYHMTWDGKEICVKEFRCFSKAGGKQRVAQLARRETSVWWSLEHKNILPFIGYCSDFGGTFALISPHISGGSLFDLLMNHPSESLDRITIIICIAEALEYLHSRGISHGDLKCANVLVSGTVDQPVPLLCDFGLSKVSGISGYTTGSTGTPRWMAKEILADGGATPAGDIWSWGMTVLEVMTAKRPFSELGGTDWAIAAHILAGNLPCWPGSPATERGLCEELWQLLLRCWSDRPDSRPSASGVINVVSSWRDLGIV